MQDNKYWTRRSQSIQLLQRNESEIGSQCAQENKVVTLHELEKEDSGAMICFSVVKLLNRLCKRYIIVCPCILKPFSQLALVLGNETRKDFKAPNKLLFTHQSYITS